MGILGIVVIGGISYLLTGTPIGLSLLGFTSGGVAAGSAAAATQAGIGNVTAGGIFAALQSAGL